MKVTKKISSLLLAAILCFATIVGFANNTAKTSVYASDDSGVKIAGISLATRDAHETIIFNSFKAKYEAEGYQVDHFIAENNASNQVSQIKELINRNVSVLVVIPVEENALVGVLTEAASKDIAIIVIGENHGLYTNAVYIDFDYVGLAESGTDDFLNNHYNAEAGATVLVVVCNNQHGETYRKAVENKFQNTSVIRKEIIIEDVDRAADEIKKWIASNNGMLPDAIFCCCCTSDQLVEQVLIDLGFTFGPGGIPIYGLGGYGNSYDALIDMIFEIMQKIFNAEIIPTGDISEGVILVEPGEE